MGPLILQGYIDEGWSYVIAVLVGVGFGFILESSGFSTSRKVVGLFYGYDFTVLRVFFTATITAMVGLLYFNYMEWIDLSMVFFPDTYVLAAVVGGGVMGLGFILGGFCPGTGVCAASIGKVDAATYVIGLYIGIFFFSGTYDWFEGIYNSYALGNVRITETLGVSTGVFAFGFVLVAIIAFMVTAWIQKRVRKVEY